MSLEKRVWLSGEEAAWLADKIVAYGEYGNDAARMLRRLSTIEQQRDELLAALKTINAIKNKAYGGAWDEIEEARAIAQESIAKCEA